MAKAFLIRIKERKQSFCVRFSRYKVRSAEENIWPLGEGIVESCLVDCD